MTMISMYATTYSLLSTLAKLWYQRWKHEGSWANAYSTVGYTVWMYIDAQGSLPSSYNSSLEFKYYLVTRVDKNNKISF